MPDVCNRVEITMTEDDAWVPIIEMATFYNLFQAFRSIGYKFD